MKIFASGLPDLTDETQSDWGYFGCRSQSKDEPTVGGEERTYVHFKMCVFLSVCIT